MATAKVLLINPNLMKPVVAPLSLDYLSASLTNHRIDSRVLDLSFSENVKQDIEKSLQKERFDVVGITIRNIDDSYFASQDFCLGKIKPIIDEVKTHTEAPVVLGGVGFSIAPVAALNYCGIDYGIWGEGELAFPLVIKELIKGGRAGAVPGLIGKGDGELPIIAPPFLDLHKVSLSKREAINNRRYFDEGGMVGFETKRGCDQPCYYCADPVAKGRKIRLRSPQDVAAELHGLLAQGIYSFHTCDSEFNLPEDHALEVCKEMVRTRIGEKIRWYAYATPAPFSEELALWMRRAGCVGVDFGVDSGDEGMLQNLGRRHSCADIGEVAARCHRHGFAFMFDLLLGGPGENQKTIANTIGLMKKLNPSRVGISLGIRLYPGTHFGKVLGKQLRSSQKGFFGEPSETMLKPLYYLSPDLGEDVQGYMSALVGGDSRFFFGGSQDIDENYNYNDNTKLVKALQQGYKGAFWDILRRIEEGAEPQ